MKDDSSLARILRQLDTGKGDEEEESVSARAIRRNEQMQDGEDMSGGQIPGSRSNVDMDDLIFAQGSHFMSNKRCQLPDGSFRKQRKGNVSGIYLNCICNFCLTFFFFYIETFSQFNVREVKSILL